MWDCVWQNGQPLMYRNWGQDITTNNKQVYLQFHSIDDMFSSLLRRSFASSWLANVLKNDKNLTFLEKYSNSNMEIGNATRFATFKKHTVMCGVISTRLSSFGQWMLVNCNENILHPMLVCEKRIPEQEIQHLQIRRARYECVHNGIYVKGFCFSFLRHLQKYCISYNIKIHLLKILLSKWSRSRTQTIGYGHFNDSHGWCAKRFSAKHIDHDVHNWYDDIKCNLKDINFWLCQSKLRLIQTKCIGDTQHRCSDGTCIMAHHVCDNIQDCRDNSDEESCSNVCTAGYSCFIECPNHYCHCNSNYIQTSNLCLRPYVWLQKWTYMQYSSLTLSAIETRDFSICPDGWSKCGLSGTGSCYPNTNICVFERTIFGDSKYCKNTEHLRNCMDHKCHSMFSCNLTYCIPFHMVCDGVVDCPDARDEEHYHCATLSCPGMFKCRHDDKCIHPNFYCDGIIHCLISQDDERFCGSCHTDCHCLGHTMTCYGLRDHLHVLNYTVNTLFIENTFIKFDLRYVNTNLIILNISRVTITSADIQNSINVQADLRYLIMINNSLSTLESYVFSNLTRLLYLVIEKNMIRFIDSYAFSGLNSIQYLNLTNLDIHVVGRCAFCGMATLREIDISNNNITQIHAGFLQFKNLIHSINISNNDIEYFDGNGINNNLLSLISNQNAICCYVNDLISSCKLIDITPICNLILMNDPISYACFLFSALILMINIYVIICRMSTNVNHFTLIQSLSFVHLLYVSYLLALITTHFWYKDTFPLRKQRWLQSVACELETFVFVLFLLQSKCSSMLLEINYVLVTKYSMTRHPLSKKAITYLLGLMWSINVTLAAVFSKYTESSDIYCTPYSITSKYKNIIYIAFTLFLTARGMFMVVCYAMILETVFRSAQGLRHVTSFHHHHRFRLLLTRSLVTIGAFVFASCSAAVAMFWKPLNKYQWLELCILIVGIPFNALIDPLQYTIVPQLRNCKQFKRK